MIKHRFYAITDRSLLPDEDVTSAINRALDSGVRMFQLREKDLSSGNLLRLGHQVAEITRNAGAQLFINDRVDIALAVGADGVHLRTSSFSPEEARDFARDLLIGASVHNAGEAIEKQQADFLLFGPVFETPDKPHKGLDELRTITEEVDCPVYAVGGITPDKTDDCFDAGAFGVAAIRSWQAPEVATKNLQYFGQL